MTHNTLNQAGSLLSRANDDKPLFPISIKFHESLVLQEQVYKDDTPITICDRLVCKYPQYLNQWSKELRRILQHYIEFEIN
jgi:hypothetical protein